MAAASVLLALVLAGPPLYVSSATSKALQVSVAAACPSEVGVLLDVSPDAVAELDERAAAIDHVQAPVHTAIAGIRVRGEDSSSPAQLVWRDGLTSIAAGSIAEPPVGDVAVPGSYAAERSLGAGDQLTATAADATQQLSFDVAGVYPDIPVQPEPAYWCGLRDLLRPDGSGDAPAPVLLADEATVRSAADGAPTVLWELHPDARHLTRSSARDLLDDLEGIVAVATDEAPTGPSASGPVTVQTAPGLGRLVDAADDAGDAVARGLIGMRLAGFVVAIGLLVVAGATTVRAGEDEMRLRVSRGETAGGLALRIAEAQALPALAGTAIGAVAAYVAVRALGPAADLDPSSVIRSGVLATLGLLLAIGVVAAAGARRADALVDPAPRRRRPVRLPWEVVPLLLALVAFARLDRTSGVRIVGTGATGGDGLGEAFPVFALAAGGALIVRPLRWLFGRARHGGHRLGPSLLLGWRRLGGNPGRYAVLAAVVAAGIGATVVASSLGLTTDRMVHDKSTTFLGADLRVVTAGEPVVPDELRATAISRVAVRADDVDVQVVGIDPDTFADAVYWRDDASEYPLADLLEVLEIDDMRGAPLPAVIVGGPVPAGTLVGDDGVEIAINPVATARFFPGKTSMPLVIVNRDALAADEVPAAAEIWLRDPPADATRELAAAGNLVRGSQGPADVFDTASVQAVRWVHQALWAFAVFMAAVALIVALHIAGIRRRDRQAARALTGRMGEPAHQELSAGLFATAVPAAIGAAVGVAAGALTIRLLADQFDTAGNLPPSAHIAYDLAPAALAGLVGLGVIVVAAITSRAVISGRATGEVFGHVEHV